MSSCLRIWPETVRDQASADFTYVDQLTTLLLAEIERGHTSRVLYEPDHRKFLTVRGPREPGEQGDLSRRACSLGMLPYATARRATINP